MASPCELLSHKWREATPKDFASFLLGMVREEFGVEKVAILWVQRKTVYWRFWPTVEIHGLGRDANRYEGPHPIIAHPPCGPWGKFSWKCFRQKKEHGIKAMELVHTFGGIVEQPLGSQLFKLHGRGGKIISVNQGDFGHRAPKATLLYFVGKQ